MPRFEKSEPASHEVWEGKHKFEHWYRDNSVYFITARCRDRFPAFAGDEAKSVFWRRFDLATSASGFQPWVTSLLDNHYHTVGYLEIGAELPTMMQALHGGVAKLVNDVLQVQYGKAGGMMPACLNELGRLLPFWRDARKRNYFDGCLRDERQGRLTHRYVRTQAERHGLVRDWREYPHTRMGVDVEQAIASALERRAFMRGVAYKRYLHGDQRGRPA